MDWAMDRNGRQMARSGNKLSHRQIINIKRKGFHADGHNLYLKVTETGTRSFVFRYQKGDKTTDVGLGAIHTTSLAEARDIARHLRGLLLRGEDPKTVRKAERLR